MPGKLIQALKASGTSNPLILIDEVGAVLFPPAEHFVHAACSFDTLFVFTLYMYCSMHSNLKFDLPIRVRKRAAGARTKCHMVQHMSAADGVTSILSLHKKVATSSLSLTLPATLLVLLCMQYYC
jgi:hypothetical protein